jgi:DNA helicase-2/ATP-dependent DNA helicase PcrA
VIESPAWDVPARPAKEGSFSRGQRVFHQKFGYGRVVAAESGKLEVEFEHGGLKHVMETFVEKA